MKTLLFKLYILLSAVIMIQSCQQRDRYVVFSGYAQGGTWAVKANMKGVKVRDAEVKAHLDSILVRIDRSLSGYNRNSLLSAFNAGKTISPDSLFVDIYERAVAVYDVTGGCVDVAAAPLYDIWGFGFKSGEMPSAELVARTLSQCGMPRLRREMGDVIASDGSLAPASLLLESSKSHLDSSHLQSGPSNCSRQSVSSQSASQSDSPVSEILPQLNYNAIAQGYSCDVVAEYLYSIGVKDMMVDIGEIYCDGLNPSGNRWTIGIDSPVDGNNTPGENLQAIFRVPEGPHGVVTSGNYRKFYVKDGKKYAHTVDPRTGYPVAHSLLSATILAPDATLADAYATYCMVLGLEESQDFILSQPEVEGCLIYDNSGNFQIWTSPGFQLSE